MLEAADLRRDGLGVGQVGLHRGELAAQFGDRLLEVAQGSPRRLARGPRGADGQPQLGLLVHEVPSRRWAWMATWKGRCSAMTAMSAAFAPQRSVAPPGGGGGSATPA